MFCLLGYDTEQQFDGAALVIDAVCGDFLDARLLTQPRMGRVRGAYGRADTALATR